MLQNYFSQDSNRKLGRDPTTPQGCLKQFSDDFPFRRPRSDRSFHVVNKIACKSSDFNVVFTIPYFCWLPPAPSTVQPIPFFPFFTNLGGTKPLLKMYVSTAYPPSSSCVSATCSTWATSSKKQKVYIRSIFANFIGLFQNHLGETMN